MYTVKSYQFKKDLPFQEGTRKVSREYARKDKDAGKPFRKSYFTWKKYKNFQWERKVSTGNADGLPQKKRLSFCGERSAPCTYRPWVPGNTFGLPVTKRARRKYAEMLTQLGKVVQQVSALLCQEFGYDTFMITDGFITRFPIYDDNWEVVETEACLTILGISEYGQECLNLPKRFWKFQWRFTQLLRAKAFGVLNH